MSLADDFLDGKAELTPKNNTSEADAFLDTGILPERFRQPNVQNTNKGFELRDIADQGVALGQAVIEIPKLVSDIGRLATNDASIFKNTSDWFEKQSNDFGNAFYSNAALQQQKNVEAYLNDPNFTLEGFVDVLKANPLAASTGAIRSVGSMAVPVGSAAGVTKLMALAGKYGKIAKEGSTANKVLNAFANANKEKVIGNTVLGSNAAMNAADTFTSTEGTPTFDRYLGAASTVPLSLVAGKLFDGGAEGVLTKALLGNAGQKATGNIVSQVLKNVAKGAGKEFGQETIEEGGNALGEQIAKRETINPDKIAKRGLYGGVLGALSGGAAGSLSSVIRNGNEQEKAQATIENALGQNGVQNPEDRSQIAKAIIDGVNKLTEREKALTQESTHTEQTQAPVVPNNAGNDANKIDFNANLGNQGEVVLQNRDRTSKASVEQMNQIANNPDYARVGWSHELQNGAPIVSYGNIPENQLGKKSFVVTKNGREPIQYAVVEADSVGTSNDVTGAANPNYGNTNQVTAIAGNGRVTGITAAYRAGKANNYRMEMTEDSALHGVNPEVIKGMKNPILVRVIPSDKISTALVDESNTAENQGLNQREKALNDANRIDLNGLEFDDNGNPTNKTLLDFVKAMPDKSELIQSDGTISSTARTRVLNAVFAKAYKSEKLIDMNTADKGEVSVRLMGALGKLAPKLSKLDGSGDLDFRQPLVEAVGAIVEGKNKGLKIQEIIAQGDMFSDPDVRLFIQVLGDNAQSFKRAVQILGDAADFVISEMQSRQDNAVNGNMFGEAPQRTREDVINKIRNDYESATNQQQAKEPAQNASGNVGSEQNATGRNAGTNQSQNDARGQQDNPGNVGQGQEQRAVEDTATGALFSRKQPEFKLEGQTEAEAQAEAERIREINRKESEQNAEALRKEREEQNRKDTARAVEASRETFSLTDDMATQEETLGGQGVLFSKKAKEVPIKDSLYAVHNISPENLLESAKLGGLPVPSIAIAKYGNGMSEFGSISLIGTKGLIDPENGTPVFTGDAYTKTFPSLEWKNSLKKDNAKALSHEVIDLANEIGLEDKAQSATYYLYYEEDPERAVSYLRSEIGKALYLKSKGLDYSPVTTKARESYPLAMNPEIQAFVKNHPERFHHYDDPAFKEFSDVYVKEAKKYVVEGASSKFAKRHREMLFGDDFAEYEKTGHVLFDRAYRLFDEAKRAAKVIGKDVVDPGATDAKYDSEIKDRNDFEKFINDKIFNYAYDKPRIKVGKKLLPITLENVVNAMKSRSVKGKQETFTKGNGIVRAMLAKRFKSLSQIQNARDRIVEREAYKDAHDEITEITKDFRESVFRYYDYPNSTWSALDDAMLSLADAGKYGKPTREKVASALRRNGFNKAEYGFDEDALDLGVKAVEKLQNIVAPYFEAKPQRAVMLDEFKGAVVPENTSNEVLDVLNKAGVEVRTYKGEDDRLAATQKLIDDLHEQRGDIRFSKNASSEGTAVSNARQSLAQDKDVGEAFTALEEAGRVEVVENVDALPQSIKDKVSGAKESRSAKNDTDVAYERGIEKLQEALRNRTSVHRAVYCKDLDGGSWVDIDWGRLGEIIDDAFKTKGAMGIQHVVDKRSISETLSPNDVAAILKKMVKTLAKGKEKRREGRRFVFYDGFAVGIGKLSGSNNYVITAVGSYKTEAVPSVGLGTAIPIPTTLAARQSKSESDRSKNVSALVEIILDNNLLVKHSDNGDIQGIYDPSTGKSYLIAENIKSGDEKGVLVHEIGCHMAEDSEFGDSLKPVIDRAVQIVEIGTKNGDATAKRAMRRLEEVGLAKNGKVSDKSEAFAYLAEEAINGKDKTSKPIREWLNKVIQKIRMWLYQHGLYLQAKNLSENDIVAIATQNVRTIAQTEALKKDGVKFSKRTVGQSVTDSLNNGNPIWGFHKDKFGNTKLGVGEWAYNHMAHATHVLSNIIDANSGLNFEQLPASYRKMLRKYRADVNNARAEIADIAESMSKLDDAERVLVSDVIEKMVKSGVNPPEYVTQIAASISNLMDAQTDALLKAGMLSEESAERWRGRYLPRIYLKQTSLLKEATEEAIKLFGRSHGSQMKGMAGNHFLGRGIFKTVVGRDSISQFKQLGWEIRDEFWNDAQGELEFKGEGAEPSVPTVVMWRDFTPEERMQMGEERDSMVRLVLGYLNSQEDIALANFFKSISENSDFCSNTPRGDWKLVPNTTIGEGSSLKRYGALAGKYVPPVVWSHLEQYSKDDTAVNRFCKMFMSFWKEGKTALNPVAHMNNSVGNVIFAYFAGVNPNPVAYYKAAQEIHNNSEEYREAEKAGLFSGSFSRTEMMEMIPIAEVKDRLTGARPGFEKILDLVLNIGSLGARKPLRKAYEFEDEFFKFVIYKHARANGASIEDSVDYANQYIFAYDDLPSGARAVKDKFLPFFSWTYKAIPVLVRTAITSPTRFLAPAALCFAINKAFYLSMAAMSGAGDDDWWKSLEGWEKTWNKASQLQDAEQAALPEQAQGYSLFGTPKFLRLWNNLDGTANFLDITRLVPGGDLMDMNNKTGGLPIPQWMMPNSPAISMGAALLMNTDLFLGRKIVGKTDSDSEAMKKRFLYAWQNISPALMVGGYHFNRLANAAVSATGVPVVTPFFEYLGTDWQGREVEMTRALAHTLGIKIKAYDFEQEIERKDRVMKSEIRSGTSKIRSKQRALKSGAISEESFKAFRDTTLEEVKERVEKNVEFLKLVEPIRTKK